jgi:hypothetical protein
MPIYGTTSYAMGDDSDDDSGTSSAVVSASPATGTITVAQAAKAKAELALMRGTLTRWLAFRATNDQVAAGMTVKTPLFKRPGATAPAPSVMAQQLATQRCNTEQLLATQLYNLLSEVFEASSLPNPNLLANPTAAVQLAQIAIAGALPTEATPTAQGSWVWPVVIIVGAIAIVIMTEINSTASQAEQSEQIACIEAGACTDSGFWLKIAAIGVVGWIVWEKMGLGERVTGALKKGSR